MDLIEKLARLRRSTGFRLLVGGSAAGVAAGGVALGQQGGGTPPPVELGPTPTPTATPAPTPVNLEGSPVLVTPAPVLDDALDATASPDDTADGTTADSPSPRPRQANTADTPGTADTAGSPPRRGQGDSPDNS